jgi:hypothetical protein
MISQLAQGEGVCNLRRLSKHVITVVHACLELLHLSIYYSSPDCLSLSLFAPQTLKRFVLCILLGN